MSFSTDSLFQNLCRTIQKSLKENFKKKDHDETSS
jgi:hypothetical protein